jgi:hypothetical protein
MWILTKSRSPLRNCDRTKIKFVKKNNIDKVYTKIETISIIISAVISVLIVVAFFFIFGLSTVDFFAKIGDAKLLINIFLGFIAVVFTFCSLLATYAKDLTKNKNLVVEIKKIISGIIFSSILIIFTLVLGHIMIVVFDTGSPQISQNVMHGIVIGYVLFLVVLVSIFFIFLFYCFLLFVLEFIFLFDKKYTSKK